MSSLGALGITTPSIFEYFKAPYNRLFGNNEKALKSYLKQSNDYNNTDNIEIDDGLPSDFDWRNQTLKCVHDVRDQQMCGSCYSFASTGFLSDRFCIHSEGNVNVTLAP
jgi:C1A family cysteine protease